MALTAQDELRHPHDDSDPEWRESVYWNFGVPELNLGGWIYAWVTPNKEQRSGMLVSFYQGILADPALPDQAAEAANHWRRVDADHSIYFFTREVPDLVPDDFDDFQLEGLRLRRISPLERYRLEFDDGVGTSFDIDCEFLTLPWDYRDNKYPVPAYLADNRYHRGWKGTGRLTLDNKSYDIEVTGDSDHSWGRRDMDEFGQHCFKMWSTQVPGDNGKVVSVIALGPDGEETPWGFVQHHGQMHSIESFEQQAEYDDQGIQRRISVTFTDASGEVTRCRAEAYANFPYGHPGEFWGSEGPATYLVDDQWQANGIISYFWPPEVKRTNPPR